MRHNLWAYSASAWVQIYTVFQKSDAKIQITITMAHLLSELIILLAASIIAFLAQTVQISTKSTPRFLSNSF